MENQGNKNNISSATKFGTFGGVFTPCTLTILGVIMFLRLGQVVGEAGIFHAILIILYANVITGLTAFSLSAISTNTRVKGGGAYYLISRSLGVEFGGTIGVFFFLAQAISVSMYVIGFTEAFLMAFPGTEWSFRTVATALFLSASRSQHALITDPFVVKAIAWSPVLINAGVFAATLSSALGSMMGAPRILQAFARDDILKGIKMFGRGR